MHKLIVLLTCCLFISAYGADEPLIVGGNDASVTEFPYQVAIKYSGQFICSGSIINKRTILTSASCFALINDEEYMTAHAGIVSLKEEGQVLKVEKIIKHEDNSGVFKNIAVVHVTQNIEFSDKVKPIALAAKDSDFELRYANLTGWGGKYDGSLWSDELQAAEVRVIPDEDCRNQFQFFSDEHLCTYAHRKGMCLNDAGDPLVVDDVQIGILSFGLACTPKIPDGHTKVSYFYDWIEKHKSNSATVSIMFSGLLLLPFINLFAHFKLF